ncbi:SpoIIE family protein phosphatase [Streptomyces griseoaurantiacus]|uniref:SpoIIE family protein phosphatase n=1 Tax=Streptomyces griseoaurantiacus TaxID=68213 RepID=UPI002E2C5087|nr:SpoIIE family protein phosphatase [Streptomyces jietaisiensis]
MKDSSQDTAAPPPPLDGIATAVLDAHGSVLHCSDTAAALVGRTASEVRGHTVFRLLTDASKHEWRLTRGPAGGRAALRPRGGGAVEVAFRMLPFDGGTGFFVIAAPARWATDWEQGGAFLHALLVQDRIGISIRDRDLTAVRSNMTPELFDGPAFPPGSRLTDVMSALDAEAVRAVLRGLLETGVPLVGHEQRLRSPQMSGRQWYLALTSVRLQDAQGNATGVATLVSDATAQRRSRRYLELAHRASVRISASLDVTRTAQDLVDVLVPALGELGWVNLAEAVLRGDEPPKVVGGGDLQLRRTAVASADGPWPGALLQPGTAVPPYRGTANLWNLQHGGAVIYDRESFLALPADPDLARVLVPEHGHSAVSAPLFARGLMLGSVTIWRTEQSDAFDQEDAELLAEIASRAALSVDNARRYTREHNAAVSLQQRLLPRATTDTPAAETAGLYLPAGGGAEISGDWFDAIPLPSLRTAFVVGDVIGHGLAATATMGRLRTAVQTLADLELSPDEVLTHLDDLVSRLAAEADPAQQDTVGSTCLYAVYDPVDGRCTLASAGHPPPVLIGPDGIGRLLDATPGPPLGVGGLPFETTVVDLAAGSVLALYTDGLIHRGGLDPDVGMRRLADRLTEQARRGSSLDALGRALLADDAGPSRDDIALLLARTRLLPEEATATWEFPADPAVVADAREAATRQSAVWGLDDATIFTTELIVSELVTNAIRYASGPVGLRLMRETALICEVSDSSNTQPRLRRARTSDEGGRGLFLVAQLSTRWGSRYGRHGKTIWAEQALPPTPPPPFPT